MVIRPGETACLACLLDTAGGLGLEETCDTAGVLGPIVNLIASVEIAEALKILSGRSEALHGRLFSSDVWSGRMQSIRPQRNSACPVCVHRKFSYLEGRAQPHITMCGRDSVQIHERNRSLDLHLLEEKLTSVAEGVRHNGFLLKALVPPYELTVFPDGRAIFKGTQDPAVARVLYAKYIGS
jgi:adenylyltransferase/sulfurtransferase